MSPRDIPADTLRKQELVSSPDASAWVSANAGSGKTTVLVRRVIRLLLAGEPPSKILCLTFTKAAAANMANKVLATLAAWVRLDDKALGEKLKSVTNEKISLALLARARRLFAVAIETPGGLKVQTIHAFCDRILHQFPLEAGVPAGFEVLDEVREDELLRRARDAVLIDAASKPDSESGRALATVVAAASDDGFRKALADAVRARRKVMELAGPQGHQALAAALGLQAGENIKTVSAEILPSPHLPPKTMTDAINRLREGAATDRSLADRLFAAVSAPATQQTSAYINLFLTADGSLRKAARFFTKAFGDNHPQFADCLRQEFSRMDRLIGKYRAAEALERTAALLHLAEAVIEHFEQAKRGRGALDYSDLIEKTADLLRDPGSAWVLYKLDGGIDHVLIDEAQDTSPAQWDVIEKLTEEFFAGKGAREFGTRTIFAVGDDKQSIFSFQGAEPKQFGAMKEKFKTRVEKSGFQFHAESLDLSFRSGRGILDAVDTVFEEPDIYNDLSSEGRSRHTALRSSAPALVEIWDTEKHEKSDDEELAWDAPLNATSEMSPSVRLAKRIAKAVRHWTDGGLAIEDRETGQLRAPKAGDVIVLVRRRGPLFEAILQALKSERLAVAGADRLQLAEHIAVMDLAALGDALLLESDDFSLACVLKSPLFGLSESDLFDLAHKRPGTLVAALENDPRFQEAAQKLARWRREALSLRPFDFYSRVLARDRGREMMLARLGPEAADAIDEFLALALSYEQLETPSLPGFLNFLRRAGTEVKRDLEVESNAVRVMTVHGAKGLEAPLVVLADTTTIPDGAQTRLHEFPGGAALLWAGRKNSESAPEQAAREAARLAREAEYRRLLYVALTRAADAVIVCGAEGNRALDEGCWYRLVRNALEEELVEVETENYGKVFRWKSKATGVAKPESSAAVAALKLPEALERAASAPKASVKREHPSELDEAPVEHTQTETSHTRLDALRRGDLLHRLLQFLPELSETERKARADNFLQSAAADLPEAERIQLCAEALAVLAHPDMAALSGARSLPEVPFLHRDPKRNSETGGRIDRLFEQGNDIILVDYKTDAKPPQQAEQVPERYRRQLGLYREAAARIYPGKRIRTLLVYSHGPLVYELS
jgi:ATP-dependent helicase/nuclease subunit A